jgi:hypothetical protein
MGYCNGIPFFQLIKKHYYGNLHTIQEVIELTEGEYQNNKIKEFFKVK